MHDFNIKEIKNSEITSELENIGFDKSYYVQASNKYVYKNLKIFALSNPQLHILKQTAISVGADCATHREVLTGKVEKSDCILGGSISQLIKIASKLEMQPFGLKDLAQKIKDFCKKEPPHKTKIMGILNLTPDSFSDGGLYNNYENATKHLYQMVKDGADIIDIGAESTKPFSNAINATTQLEKILPILEFINKEFPNRTFEISIDTRSAKVAQECIKYGVNIINDVSGFLYDSEMVNVVANSNVKIVIQHSKGEPENMQQNPTYDNLMDEIYSALRERINFAISQGVKKENIIIDPGIGFGKTREDNFEIIRRIEEFNGLGSPILLGLSRKSLLNMQNTSNEKKDIYTLALNALAITRNVDIIRVHNVKLHKTFMDMYVE